MLFSRDKKNILRWIDCVLPAYFLISIVECYLGLWHLNSFVKLFSIILTLIFVKQSRCKNIKILRFVKFFIFYNLFTIIMYVFSNRPISLVTDDLLNYLPVMLYVWVGINDDRIDNSYYRLFFVVGACVFILGLICYIGNIGWYMNRMAEARNNSWYLDRDIYDADSILASLRFCSFFMLSYQVSHFAVYGVSIGLFFSFCKKIKLKYTYFFTIVFIISAVLCQHRVAMASSFAFCLIYFFYEFKKRRRLVLKIISVLSVLVVFVLLWLNANYGDRMILLTDQIFDRIDQMSYSQAMEGSRTDKTAAILKDFHMYLFGEGLGSASPSAALKGLTYVSDAAYVKILFETGIVGLIIFLYISIISLIRAFKNFKYYSIDCFIILFVLLAMTGSNSLTLGYLLIIPFWYAIGHVWNVNYLKKAKQNNLSI